MNVYTRVASERPEVMPFFDNFVHLSVPNQMAVVLSLLSSMLVMLSEDSREKFADMVRKQVDPENMRRARAQCELAMEDTITVKCHTCEDKMLIGKDDADGINICPNCLMGRKENKHGN